MIPGITRHGHIGMNSNNLFDYPSWLILLCLFCGLVYSALLYYKNTKAGFALYLKRILAVFRFLVVSVLAFLLLAPLVQKRSEHVEEPLLIFLQDNSGSLLYAQDAAWYEEEYVPGLDGFMETASGFFDTRLYTFGEQFSRDGDIDFSERVTDMSDAFREVDRRYSNRNVGAIIVAGDGLYNRGVNPLYAASGLNHPLYTIAMGDTTVRRDLILKQVNHNQITYLGNHFPVEIVAEGLQCGGLTTNLTVRRDGEELYSERITLASDHHIETISFHLEADKPGMQQYHAALSPVEDEISVENNHRDFFIDVIDGRQQVLILANSPHPDVGAIRESLLNNDHYEADVFLKDDFSGSLEAYDLVILHQLPSRRHPLDDLFEQAGNADASLLFILGKQTSIDLFNRLPHGIGIERTGTSELIESLPVYNQGFVLFSMHESTRNLFDQVPPLYSPFASYSVPGNTHTMLTQKIGSVATTRPLVFFSGFGDRRTGVITGEGIWRWRLHSYLHNQHHQAFDDMMARMVQYLALQEDRRLFRVQAESLVDENENVLFEAELYNPSYELINDPEVHLVITNEEGIDFPYTMGRTSNAYRLDAGSFGSGTYQWSARVHAGGELLTDEGVFTVSALDLEGQRTIADHNLLFQLSENSGAEMYGPDQWDELMAGLLERDDISPRLYEHKEYVEIINLKVLFFIILLLLSTEWFIRKRSGGY